MNPIERVMSKRTKEFKGAVAVAALLLVLWATGASLGSVWPIPVIAFILWVAIQQGLRYRHRRRAA